MENGPVSEMVVPNTTGSVQEPSLASAGVEAISASAPQAISASALRVMLILALALALVLAAPVDAGRARPNWANPSLSSFFLMTKG